MADASRALTALAVAWSRHNGWTDDLTAMVVWGESEFDLSCVGDSGASFGGIQVYTNVWGGDASTWSGLDGLVRSLVLMAPRWAGAYTRLGPPPADPDARAHWFQVFWPMAQGCEPPAFDRCQQAVAHAAALVRAYQGDPTMPFYHDPASGLDFPVQGVITQPFGPTTETLEPAYTWNGVAYPHFHMGIDIAPPLPAVDIPIYAMRAGTVTWSGWRNRQGQAVNDGTGTGITVIVTAADGNAHLYGHMAAALVTVGQTVAAGDLLGRVGSTGASTGPHTHYEVHDAQGNLLDPTAFLRVQPAPVPVTGIKATTTDALNLRAAPGTDQPVIATMPKGESVTVATDANGWLPVYRADGQHGYARADFLTLELPDHVPDGVRAAFILAKQGLDDIGVRVAMQSKSLQDVIDTLK